MKLSFPTIKAQRDCSSALCNKHENDSVCSSCEQDTPDVLYSFVPSPTRSLDLWGFPSSRSGLRTSVGPKSRLCSILPHHGAAFAGDETRIHSRCQNVFSPSARKEVQQRAGPRVSQSCCCCCSDSSTQCGTIVEASRLMLSTPAWPSVNNLQQLSVTQQQQVSLINVPTVIEARGLKCVILDAPTNENLHAYLAELHNIGVTDMVRTCSRTYDDAAVVSSGIRVHDLSFVDGEAPPPEVVSYWRSLVDRVSSSNGALAVHCVAGLGRGPVLVAISLMDRGFNPEAAVQFIRARRKGAINRRQMAFLQSYRRNVASKRCLKGCVVM